MSDRHGYGTRGARAGLVVGSTDHRVVAYRVPVEWGCEREIRVGRT